MAKSNSVIIKRVKKGGHGHHGGAWKVAYADFVTAMMAFFLLLWLLNATTDAQKRGIADYFSPTVATKSTTSGAGGVLGGHTVLDVDGSKVSSYSAPSMDTDPERPQNSDDQDSDEQGHSKKPTDDATDSSGYKAEQSNGPNPQAWKRPSDAAKAQTLAQIQADKAADAEAEKKMGEAEYKAMKAEHEEKDFKQAQYQIQQAIQDMPDLKPLARNLVVDRTEEGLRIQLVDQEKTAMFPTGSTALSEQAQKLMALVTQAVGKLQNRIAITGHTDSTQFAGSDRGGYSNWELSTDRANAARRALIASGLPEDRIASVQGKADTENLVNGDPADPRNRRISIVVLRDSGPAASASQNHDDANRADAGAHPKSTAMVKPAGSTLAAE